MSVLFQLLRTFHFRDKNIFVKLYKTYVRPLLEFSAPVWNPWLAKDTDILERVQRKFVKNVSGLQGRSYEDRLIELELLSLSDRRIYLELVEVFKIVKGLTNVDRMSLIELNCDSERRATRAAECPVNIVKKRCNLDIRKYFFTNRVANTWNDLPDTLKMSDKLASFKKELKSHLISMHLVRNV